MATEHTIVTPSDYDLRVKALEFATQQYGAQTFTVEQAVARATKFLAFLKATS